MSIDNKIVEKIAKLSRISLEDNEVNDLSLELSQILDWVEQLSEINTDDIEPLIYINEEVNTMRSDNIKCNITREESLKNAPKKDSDYFKVPTVLKK